MKVLVICFANISKVASVVPVLESVHRLSADTDFVMLSQKRFEPLFSFMNRVAFLGVDLRSEFSGLLGAVSLFLYLRKERFDYVVDLQGTRYTRFLTAMLAFSGVKRSVVDNQVLATERLIKLGARRYRALKSIFERYSDAFTKVGLRSDDQFVQIPIEPWLIDHNEKLYGKKRGIWLGIAPFSEARGKTLPQAKIEEVIAYFDKLNGVKIFLFGLGEHTDAVREDWSKRFKNSYFVNDALKTMHEELSLMSQLDAMISMDSGNMHLAALTATTVISVWGETHPYAGYLGWKQPYENCCGVSLSCRPCTEHADKKCRYGDYRCLENIRPNTIIVRTLEAIEKAQKEQQIQSQNRF